MKNIYSIVASTVLCTTIFGQTQKKIDSILIRLSELKTIDTARISSFNSLSYYYYSVNPELGIKYADAALQLATKFKSKNHIAQAYQSFAINYTMQGANDIAQKYYQKSLDLAIRIKNQSVEAHAYHGLAYLNSIQGENKKAIEFEKKAYTIFNAINKKKKAGSTLNSIGSNYFYLSEYNNALTYYLKALNIAEEIKDNVLIATAYENIGLLYKRLNNNKKAFYYFEKSIEKFQEGHNESQIINVLTNYGNAKDQAGQTKEALKIYNRALLLAIKTKNIRSEYSLITNIAIAEFGLKDYDKAIVGFQKANAFFESTGDLRNLSVGRQYLAETLIDASDDMIRKAGFNPKQKFTQALELTQACLNYSTEINAIDDQMYCREVLSKIYNKKGDFKASLEQYKLFTALKDSVTNNENREEILTKELQYEADKKQAVANAEIQKQKAIKYATFGGSGLVLLSGFFLFIGYKRRRSAKEIQNELLLKAKISDTEMRALRLQLNPHFIFNSLNSISDYIGKNDIKTADYYLAKFAKLMRGILENSEEKEIPLADELKMLELYMQLESSRLNHKFTFEIKVEQGIDPETTLVPPLILQPFVENSIWHGLAQKDGAGKIIIEVTKENAMLNCIVEDDGIGRKNASTSNGKSYGMKITKDRIELLNKFKNTNASVNLIDLEKGTRVEVKLPFEEEL
jgi:tetratricopeptide (TPR) repeat protein